MPAQIALSLVWILVGPQERKETVKGHADIQGFTYVQRLRRSCTYALDWMLQGMKRRFTHILSASVATTRYSAC